MVTDELIVEKHAKLLANKFRDGKIDKQLNVPFIGIVMLCYKFGIIKNEKGNNELENGVYLDINYKSTKTILNSLYKILENKINFTDNLNRKKKKELLKKYLDDESLKNANRSVMLDILNEI